MIQYGHIMANTTVKDEETRSNRSEIEERPRQSPPQFYCGGGTAEWLL